MKIFVATFMILSRWILLGTRNVSGKSCRESQNAHFLPKNLFSENCLSYEIIWKNTIAPDWPQMTIWRMRFACCIT